MTSIKENRAQIIVIIEWVLFTVATSLLLFLAINYTVVGVKKNYPYEYGNDISAVWIFVALTAVINLILTGILTYGVHGGHPCSCKTWYVIYIIFLVLGVGGLFRLRQHYLALAVGFAIYAYRIYAVKTIIDYTSTLVTSPGRVYEQRKPDSLGAADPPPYNESNKGNANVV